MIRRLLPAALAGLLAAGCDGILTESAPRYYLGTYMWGFEVSEFKPCGSDEYWWLRFATQEVDREYRARLGRPQAQWEHIYLEVEGELSERGQYGHMGAHEREFRVTRVLEARPAGEFDCR